jgi:HlyD family secretion protein
MKLRLHGGKRLWSGLLGILLVGGALSVALFGGEEEESGRQQYTVAQVTRGDIVRSVNAVGQLLPLTSVEVSSQISGLVTEVHVDFNSSVKKGQLLAKIDPSTYEQQLRQRRADLAAAKASFKLAQINEQRLKDLNNEGIATQQEYDQAIASRQQANAALLSSEAAIENARVDLERCSITSPIDGTVIFKQIEVGKTVVSSMNAETLFTISPDLSRMKIIARVSEVDVGEVRPGQDVTFTVDALPERQFQAKVMQVRNPYTPSGRQQTESPSLIAMFEASIELDNPGLVLRPGLTANISIAVEQRSDVLQIPNSALRVTFGDQSAPTPALLTGKMGNIATIYRLPPGDRTASPTPVLVRLGLSDSFVTEVSGGLSEGDAIVTGIAPAPYQPPSRGLFGLGS